MRIEGNNCWAVDAARSRADAKREDAYRVVLTQLANGRISPHEAVQKLRDAYRSADRDARGLDS